MSEVLDKYAMGEGYIYVNISPGKRFPSEVVWQPHDHWLGLDSSHDSASR